MFGTYRTILAIFVVASHLISATAFGGFAVHGFFILSGYLMTLIMSDTYGYDASGVKAFAMNRFLRLYPTYSCVIAFSIGLIALYPAQIAQYNEVIYLPTTLKEWGQNLTMVYLNIFPLNEQPRMSPPTWALTNELFFYLLIALGVSRSRKSTVIWFAVSVSYFAATHILKLGQPYRYHMVLAASLPFSLGALIFHFRSRLSQLSKSSGAKTLYLLSGAWIANAFLYTYSSGLLLHISYYLNYLVNAFIIILLIDKKIPFISKSRDKTIGDYSYPIYLLHWQTGFLASMLLFGEPIKGMSLNGIISALFALLISAGISFLAIKTVEQPIENVRRSLKKKAHEQRELQPSGSME